MALYLAVPFVALTLTPKLEPAVILWLWLPVELGILRAILITRQPGTDLHYIFAQLLAIDAGIIAFVVWNRTPKIGYRLEADRTEGRGTWLVFFTIQRLRQCSAAGSIFLMTSLRCYSRLAAIGLNRMWTQPGLI